jgi:hypothetical protein
MRFIFRYLNFLPMLFLAGNLYAQLPGPSETWCPPQACTVCDRTISTNVNFEVGNTENVCLIGNFTYTREIEMNGGILCVGPEVIVEVNNLNELKGNWTIHNHGTIRISNEFKILRDQAFYNYGTFEILTNDEFIIEVGGFFCNSGDTKIEGDLINRGTLFSSGYFYVGDEFKNDVDGVAQISQMLVKDEISNLGTIYLEGYIESLNKSFKNFANSKVIGLENPCNAIRARKKIENLGLIEGGTERPIIIAVNEADYSGGSGSIVGDVVFSDTPGLSEDCFRILPVEWSDLELDFTAEDRTVNVHWATLKEWDNSHFDVQRAVGYVYKWENIGSVDGVGFSDSRTAYSYVDIDLPLAGGNLYYRVRQEDLNGKSSFSEVLLVNVPEIFHAKGVWRAYPNPTQDGQMRVGLLDRNEYNGESLTFRLIHPTSVTESMTVSNEDEMNEILTTWVPKFPKGLFVVEIRWGQKLEHIKVLKK